jgi:asparagine synthase (glutamine-hydrolysing)
MSVSLEARSPFLDQKMIELACKIPFDLKFKGGDKFKYLLKKAVEKIVPAENIYRQKMGFTIPLGKWFTGNVNSYAKGVLLAKKGYVRKFIHETRIKEMLTTHSEENDLGLKLWSLLTLELWFRNYFKNADF